MNPPICKKDYFVVAIIGSLVGLLALPILNNVKISLFRLNFGSGFLIVVGVMVLAVFALWFVSLLSRRLPVLLQFAKFAAVGALNTLLDLGVLNLLIFFSGIALGYWYSLFKAVSFIIASINSYLWNKYWTFGVSGAVNVREFGQFFIVTLIGFGINVSVASIVVNVVGPVAGISENLWANIGALSATVISLLWNFIGYKFIVFKR